MEHNSQAGKVWFITGASSGFGRALAEEVLARGGRVVAAARRVEPLAALALAAPGRVVPLALDVTRGADLPAAAGRAAEAFGRLDVLVNNAGYSLVGAVEETSDAELRVAMETMFFGAAALSRAVLPRMRGQAGGTIVQITSVGGLITVPGFGAYCAAKHALEAYSEALAAEVKPFGVRVLIVEPGAFRTDLMGGAFRRMPPMPEYAQTVGPTRDYADSSAGLQPGDPARAARAIVEAVQSAEAPLRLPLGGDAVDGVRAKLRAVAADVDRTELVARATAF